MGGSLMNAEQVLKTVRTAGGQLILFDGKLKGKRLDNVTRPLVKKHKTEIISLLQKTMLSPSRVNDATVEPNLKHCPLCNGHEFTHGNQGGYFCTTCQPGSEGEPILASGKRSVTYLKGHYSGLSMPEDNHSALARTPRGKASSSFNAAHKWILQHKQELLGAGWSPSELYRRNKSRGISLLSIWDKPGVDMNVGRNGEIVFHFKNTTGKNIQQTVFPRRHYGNK
jgi:hypothetical protein